MCVCLCVYGRNLKALLEATQKQVLWCFAPNYGLYCVYNSCRLLRYCSARITGFGRITALPVFVLAISERSVKPHYCLVTLQIYIMQWCTVQDPAAPPSDTLLLPPLTSLHSAAARNQELPQPGESRSVLPPSQRALSRQLMRAWGP